eukprot:12406422-Karenia_brevis.AAC.1
MAQAGTVHCKEDPSGSHKHCDMAQAEALILSVHPIKRCMMKLPRSEPDAVGSPEAGNKHSGGQ